MNCDRCNEPMIEIEHDGEQLIGCMDCNCWKGSRSAFIVDLSIEEVQALRDVGKRVQREHSHDHTGRSSSKDASSRKCVGLGRTRDALLVVILA
jgi:hypothetical protein